MKVNIGPYRKNRKMDVKIDTYDIWSMHHTMSLILLPLFQKFRNTGNRTIPCIAFKDPLDHSNESWELAERKWLDTIDKIIWSLNEIVNETEKLRIPDSLEDEESYKEKEKNYELSLQEGFDLLGKYFQHFWC